MASQATQAHNARREAAFRQFEVASARVEMMTAERNGTDHTGEVAEAQRAATEAMHKWMDAA